MIHIYIPASRRSFITGLAAIITAPAIVRASSLMSVKALKIDPWQFSLYGEPLEFDGGFDGVPMDQEMANLFHARMRNAEKAMQEWLNEHLYSPDPNPDGLGLQAIIS